MKKSKTNCDLNSCMFCRLCLKEWLPAIDANRKTYLIKKGETVFREGDKVRAMYFVVNGSVKVRKKWGEKELILRFAKAGLVFGHRGLCSDLVYPISATAIEPSTICSLDIEFFNASLKVNHEFLYQFMLFFAEELKVSEEKMRNLAHMSVKGRIANALLALKEKFGLTPEGYINVTLTRQDLASFVGTTYETVFRVLNEFIEEGVIRTSEKDIAIIDEIPLRKASQ